MLDASYAACRQIVRRANSSFPLAFRLLSPPKRRAMDALYAFARLTDDISDEPGEPDEKRIKLEHWRTALVETLAGRDPAYPPVFPALRDTIERYAIPHRYLFDIIDGVEMDLEPLHFATFEELRLYCYRVAGAVGLACIRIWGVKEGGTFDEIDGPAEAAGIAFQLTNILRDLAEDSERGRCYLPRNEDSKNLTFQIERARGWYRHADGLDHMLTNEGRAIFRVMSGTYRALLERIAKDPMAVFRMRVRVPKWRKAAIFLAAWPVKWGLR
jgi:15-cis-phytoene synthase